MKLANARAMVAQLFWYAPQAQQDAIAAYMAQEDVNAMHAAWTLYGRVRGYPCTCTPCLSAPPIGSEVVMRIIVGAGAYSRLEDTMGPYDGRTDAVTGA